MFFRTVFVLSLSAATLGYNHTAVAETVDETRTLITEAEELRASEFAPTHLSRAKSKLQQAEFAMADDNKRKSAKLLTEAATDARQASALTQKFSREFSALVESRDRLKLAGDKYNRADLAERSEKEFSSIVQAAEQGKLKKAKREVKNARRTLNAALTVAAREQFVRPVSRAVAKARKQKARDYAPKALKQTVKLQSRVERLIKSNPDAQAEAYALSQQGQRAGHQAIRIAKLGYKLDRNPGKIETWVNSNDQRLATLALALGIQLDQELPSERHTLTLKQAIQAMQAEHQAQLADAAQQTRELSEKLAKYQGDMESLEGELVVMAGIRHKLQLKREAEAKIKRLTKLFDAEAVEILLTPDADVIFRMKKLNFLSGSAVIPPEAYALLNNAIKSIDIFPNRNVRIEGHTDFMGTNEYNQELSERRSDAVKEYLHQNMAEFKQQLVAVGHGEEKPIANNETSEGRTKNRRIDIILIAPRATIVETKMTVTQSD